MYFQSACRFALDIAVKLLCAAVSLVIAYNSRQIIYNAGLSKQLSASLRIPMAGLYALVAVMFCLIAFRFLQAVFKMIVRKRRLKPNHEHISDDDGSISGICIPWDTGIVQYRTVDCGGGLGQGYAPGVCITDGIYGIGLLYIPGYPMFILAGYLMETGGLSKRLVNFAASLVGNIHGGLGIITVLACAFFAAISGSSPGTVAAVGAMMIPPMVEKGYDRDFSAALTASAGSLGVLIPPSIPMVLYCIAGEVSIGEMFMAGFIPGFLMTAALALTTYVISKRMDTSLMRENLSGRRWLPVLRRQSGLSLPPVIILGGIYSGIFTPTEAAVVVVVYSMFVGLFITKELKVSDLPGILYKGAVTAGTTVFILAFAMAFSRYLTLNQIPQLIGSVILGITGNVHVILILFVLLCFVTGTFLETASQVLIYTPLFLPTLKGLGVSPLHFGILLTVGDHAGHDDASGGNQPVCRAGNQRSKDIKDDQGNPSLPVCDAVCADTVCVLPRLFNLPSGIVLKVGAGLTS